MKIASVQLEGPGALDRLLSVWAQALLERGVRVRGVIRDDVSGLSPPNERKQTDHRCNMTLKVLPNGKRVFLAQQLGSGSQGCRIDPAALETVAAAVEQSVQGDTDLLLINKFGKFEARGRGLVAAIARAQDLDVPVLCGVNDYNVKALEDFTEGMASSLAPTIGALDAWLSQPSTALHGPGDRNHRTRTA